MNLTKTLAGAVFATALFNSISLSCAESSMPAGLPNAFFAMDTGTKDANHQAPESQAQLVKELGYAGIGCGIDQMPAMLPAVDQHGLKLFAVYTGLEIGAGGTVSGQLKKLVEQLHGRDTFIWLYLTSKQHKPSAAEGDQEAVKILREVADLTKAANLRVALYPHSGFWLERVQDAVRVAKKVDRDNVGVTFNLCHCLKVGDEAKIPELLALARPRLFVVTLNGADHEGNWDRLIQTLDRGAFDVLPVARKLKELGFTGPIGLQHYGIKGDARENLKRSLDGWRSLSTRAAQP